MPAPPGEGLTALVTGGSQGIGLEIARGLLEAEMRVCVLCRDERSSAKVHAQLDGVAGPDALKTYTVDLSSQGAVRAFCAGFIDEHDSLNVLINNAATHVTSREVTPEGFELTWATNVLGPFLLTELLLDLLGSSTQSRRARVVNITTSDAEGFDFNDPQSSRTKYQGVKAYRASKHALRLLTWDLDERLPGTGIVANACYPGRVDTRLGRLTSASLLNRLMGREPVRPVAVGADTPLWLASGADIEGFSGGLFFERQEIEGARPSPGACAALGELCSEMVGLEAPD